MLPECHSSALATSAWRSDKHVKKKKKVKKARRKIFLSTCGIAAKVINTSPVFQCRAKGLLDRFKVGASVLARIKQKFKKCVCVWNVPCRNIMDLLTSFVWLHNNFLSAVLFGWLMKLQLCQELQKQDFFNRIFSLEQEEPHNENLKRTYLATGDIQPCILGFGIKCYDPLFSFTVHCPNCRSILLEMFRRISKSSPWAIRKHTTSESKAERPLTLLKDYKMMMKGKLQG